MAGIARSDGQYHARITTALIVPAALLGAILPVPLAWPLRTLWAAGGCVFGYFCGPDLDQESMLTENEWAVLRLPVIGWLLGSVWVALWIPYALATRHRGLSHVPLVGTLTRMAYLAIWIFLAEFLMRGALRISPGWWLVEFYVGLAVADVGHWARDTWGLTL